MKANLLFVGLAISLALGSVSSSWAADNQTNSAVVAKTGGKLVVEVNSASNDKGQIQVHLLNAKAQFDNEQAAFARCQQVIKHLTARCEFSDIPFGDYAIFAFHDENANQNLDENFFGVPTEKLAISRIDLAQNQQPEYHQAKFEFNSPLAQYFLNLQ